MSLRIRRGSESERTSLRAEIDQGELLWVTDSQKLYVGLGNNLGPGAAGGLHPGMVNIGAALAGDGLAWDDATQTLKFGGVNYTTDDVQEGVIPGRQYFTEERAVDAVASALVAGQGNVTFVYNTTQDNAGRIDATVTLDGIGITSVEADTSPTLGGNLDAASFNITSVGTLSVSQGSTLGTISISANSVITTSEFAPPGSDRSDSPLFIGTNASPTTLWVKSDNNFAILTGLTDGTNTSGLTFKQSRGTLATPATLIPGDPVTFFEGFGHNGTAYTAIGAFGLSTDPNWDGFNGTNGEVPSQFGALVLDKFGTPQFLQFNSQGVLSVPIFKATGYATGSLPTTTGPNEEGYIVFDSTTKQFKGWNGTVWVVLG